MSYDAQKVTYQEVTIFDRPALFTECRIDRATVPEGVYRYELRPNSRDRESLSGITKSPTSRAFTATAGRFLSGIRI